MSTLEKHNINVLKQDCILTVFVGLRLRENNPDNRVVVKKWMRKPKADPKVYQSELFFL